MNFVLTLSGPDRIGIVDEVTGLLLQGGGNVETSRMATPAASSPGLDARVDVDPRPSPRPRHGLARLIAQGYKVTTTRSDRTYAESHAGWTHHEIDVEGADHEGIIHDVARYLARRGINIESMDSETTPPRPHSGVPIFTMTAHVAVSPEVVERGGRTGCRRSRRGRIWRFGFRSGRRMA